MRENCSNRQSVKRNHRCYVVTHNQGGNTQNTIFKHVSSSDKRTKSKPTHSVQSRTNKSVVAPRKSSKKRTSRQDFRNMKEWNTQGTLRQNFFQGVPNCFVDNDLLNRFTDEELPGEIKSSADYAKWLGLSERFSPQGRAYFQDNFVPFVVDLLGSETVRITNPDTSMSDVSPPVQGILPTEDPFAEDELGIAQVAPETVDLGDSPDISPYMSGIKEEQVTMSKKTREKYRQLALKEADQRQLLMLLCGNVEASMFVDKQGQIRSPEQIIEHTLFLLKPYRMGNSILGEIMQWMNFGINVAWKNGFTVVCIVAQVVGILLAIDMLTKVHTMLLEGKEGPFRAFHSLMRGIANGLMWFIETQWNTFCRFIGRKCLSKPVVNQLTKRDYDKWLRVLTTNGFSALCLLIASKYKPDYDMFQQMNIAQYAIQMVKDRYQQVLTMNYLAQLTPGILGEDLSSGISIKQLNLMIEVQEHFIEIDKEVDALTNDQMSGLLLKFTEAEGELTEFMVEIGNIMMSRYQASLTSEDTNVQAFRKQLITMFSQEMRVFHFLDAYGHPRNVTDICKVFFLYWKRSRESQLIPTIPHQGGPISRWFDLTPVKFTPVKRSFATQKAKRSSSAAELMNTPNHQWWRQHAYLYKNIKNPISLEQALQENPSAEIATLTPQQLKQMKKYPGWTHRISEFTISSFVDKFQLSVNRLDDAYQQHVEVVVKGKGVKSVDWIPSREGMGYGKGTIRHAMPTSSSQKPSGVSGVSGASGASGALQSQGQAQQAKGQARVSVLQSVSADGSSNATDSDKQPDKQPDKNLTSAKSHELAQEAKAQLQDLFEKGLSLKEIKDSGYTGQQFKEAGYSVQDFKDADFTLKNIKGAGFNLREIKNAGFSYKDLKKAGFSAQEFKEAGCLLKDLKEAGFNRNNIIQAGYSKQEFNNGGWKAGDFFLYKDAETVGFFNTKIGENKLFPVVLIGEEPDNTITTNTSDLVNINHDIRFSTSLHSSTHNFEATIDYIHDGLTQQIGYFDDTPEHSVKILKKLSNGWEPKGSIHKSMLMGIGAGIYVDDDEKKNGYIIAIDANSKKYTITYLDDTSRHNIDMKKVRLGWWYTLAAGAGAGTGNTSTLSKDAAIWTPA